MKKIVLAIGTIVILALSSCYVEVVGEHHYHRPFWHHRAEASLEIRGENNVNPDSLQTPLAPETGNK